MNLSPGAQTLQLLAWLFALIETILAFYALALNARHPANRHLSALVLFLALNNLALGLFVGAENLEQTILPSYLLAATSFAISPAVALVTVVLLQSGWLHGRCRWVWRSLYIFSFIFPALTLIDLAFSTQIWYTGLNVAGYLGGYLPLATYVSPKLYEPAMVLFGYVLGLVPFIPIVATLRDKESPRLMRQLAWLLLVAQLVVLVLQSILRSVLPYLAQTFVSTAVFAIAYVYTAFQQMVSERRLQRGQLRTRLTVIFLVITAPVLVIGVLLVGLQARLLLVRTETTRLGAIAHLLTSAIGLRTDYDEEELTELVRLSVVETGDTGVVYIVDAENRIVVHSELAFDLVAEDDPMRDFSLRVPVVALRHGNGDRLVVFTDTEGQHWWSYSTELRTNQWGIVVQQQESVLSQTTRQFSNLSWIVIVVGITLLAVLGFLAVRQALGPIASLTQTARAIADGDLNRLAQVESEDEIGVLAQAFNSVTRRLNELIESLEARVAERTQEVERRAEYLAITGGVSRVAASILDVDTLLERVTRLISEQFGFYHTGIFLLDEAREWAVFRASSSEGGQRMLARAHRLRVGEQGIVGYTSGTGRSRIALDVDEDVVWVKNPDLPGTRSEMALPLIIGQQVIGVLDVQSTEAAAFSTEDVATLRILADQIAVAIRNAQLFEESQANLRELQRSYGEEVQRGWAARTSPVMGYHYTPAAVGPLTTRVPSPSGPADRVHIDVDNTLLVPLQLAGAQTFGQLRIQRDAEQSWTRQEIVFVQKAAQDMAQALEVARLLAQSRQTAMREQMIVQVTNAVRQELYIENVLRTAVDQVQTALGLGKVVIQMASPEMVDAAGGQNDA